MRPGTRKPAIQGMKRIEIAMRVHGIVAKILVGGARKLKLGEESNLVSTAFLVLREHDASIGMVRRYVRMSLLVLRFEPWATGTAR